MRVSLHRYIRNSVSEWMRGKGPQSDIVISSRVRVARNLAGLPFPVVAKEHQAKEVLNRGEQVIRQGRDNPVLSDAKWNPMADVCDLVERTLVEEHLSSLNLAEVFRDGTVILGVNEAVCVVVNEEDHLRIQCLFPGFQLVDAWRLSNQLDDWFEKRLNYAFDEKCGFLTSCPTNVGTGIRASVMVHLPALAMAEQLNRLLPAI